MDPALSPLGSFIGKFLGDVFVTSRKRRVSIEELRGRVQELAISNEQARIAVGVSEQRIAFLESFIAALVASGYFYRDSGYIRVAADISRPQIAPVIQGAVESAEATSSAQSTEDRVEGKETLPEPSSRGAAAADIFLGGFLEELREKRRDAGA